MKTWNAKIDEVERKWWVVDATDQVLGRFATQIAQVIRGKNKPQFTPNVDTGDFVVVVNAEKIKMTGAKLSQKKYYRHSRYFGGLKSFTAEEMIEKDPAFVIEEAIKGMLPKTKLGRQLLLKLKTYKGPEHPHATQKPEALKLTR
jgi:large subunit ribosomal protein L13